MSTKTIKDKVKKEEPVKVSAIFKRKQHPAEKQLEDQKKALLDTLNARRGKPFIRTPFNAFILPKYHELNTLPSLTIPDQTLTVRQIMEKHRRGLPVDIALQPEYFGDEQIPDMKRLDLSEQHAILENAKAQVRETQKKIDRQQWNERVEKAALLRQQQIEKQKAEASSVSEPPVKDKS